VYVLRQNCRAAGWRWDTKKLMVLSNLTCQFSKKSEKKAYNFNEYVDMLLCLGASNDNASEAARDYARLYPQRRHPDAKVIRRLMQR
jgi:hypothetical protein